MEWSHTPLRSVTGASILASLSAIRRQYLSSVRTSRCDLRLDLPCQHRNRYGSRRSPKGVQAWLGGAGCEALEKAMILEPGHQSAVRQPTNEAQWRSKEAETDRQDKMLQLVSQE